jgi:hypothetical protein
MAEGDLREIRVSPADSPLKKAVWQGCVFDIVTNNSVEFREPLAMSLKFFDRKLKKGEHPSPVKARAKEQELESAQIGFPMPEADQYAFYDLDPLTKRKVTICNLFANHHKTVAEIVELLNTSRKLVIDTLVEYNLLKDRRRSSRPRTPSPEELGKKKI